MRKNGQPVRDFRTAWHNAIRRAGLEGNKFHGLRRGMAVQLRAAGIDEQTAAMITGHKDLSVFRRYRILRRDAILQAGRKLEKAKKVARRS